jgi:hypothetical protein
VKKTVLRIQAKGGRAPVVAMMEAMIRAGIPFVMANSVSHPGSRATLRDWGENSDLLFALVRDSDVAMIRLINTECTIRDNNHVWWSYASRPKTESDRPAIRLRPW